MKFYNSNFLHLRYVQNLFNSLYALNMYRFCTKYLYKILNAVNKFFLKTHISHIVYMYKYSYLYLASITFKSVRCLFYKRGNHSVMIIVIRGQWHCSWRFPFHAECWMFKSWSILTRSRVLSPLAAMRYNWNHDPLGYVRINLTKVRPLFTLSHRRSDNSPLLIVFKWTL